MGFSTGSQCWQDRSISPNDSRSSGAERVVAGAAVPSHSSWPWQESHHMAGESESSAVAERVVGEKSRALGAVLRGQRCVN